MFDYIENDKVLYYHTFRPEIFFVTNEEGVVVSDIEVNLGRNHLYEMLDMTCDSRGEPTPRDVRHRAMESLMTYLNVIWEGKETIYK